MLGLIRGLEFGVFVFSVAFCKGSRGVYTAGISGIRYLKFRV